MTRVKKLVIGASGFLGSHVTRQLVADGHAVRVLLRTTSSTRGIDDVPVERCHGSIFDGRALRAAMAGCDVVFYCVVDARFWLRDPEPLWRTNVEGLRQVLDAALDSDLDRFVFTSSSGTMAIRRDGIPVTEDDPHNWTEGGPYIASRVAAEKLVLEYARDRGLPAIALCPSITYGPGDWGPTPHGSLLARVATGRFPFYFDWSAETVGIEDAALAMVLAADNGRVGERYIISDRYLSCREIHEIAADAVGVRRPRRGLPPSLVATATRLNDLAAALLRRDLPMTAVGQRIADLMSPLDHSKAVRELGWTPQPVEESIHRGAQFFVAQQ